MTLAYPWSGRDWGGGVPVGRQVPGLLVGRQRAIHQMIRDRRGLGQEEATWVDVTPTDVTPTDVTPPFVGTGPITQANVGSSTSTAPWLVRDIISPALKAGSTIADYELNPLYQKQTYYRTPQGTIYASNVPSGYVPGLTTATGGISLLPILLIGGLVLLFMARR